MRIGVRLGLSFALILGLLIAVSAVSLYSVHRLASVTNSIVYTQTNRVFLAQLSNQHSQAAANDLLKLLLTTDQVRRVPLYNAMDTELAASDDALTKIANSMLDPGDDAQLKQLCTARDYYHSSFGDTVVMIEAEGLEKARDHFETVTAKALEELLRQSSEFAGNQRHKMLLSLDQLQQTQRVVQLVVLILALVATVIGCVLAALITRAIVRPIAEAVTVAETIADGTLDGIVPIGKDDEIGKLLSSLGVMRDSIVSRENKIKRLAYVDLLTELPNRTAFIESYASCINDDFGAIVQLDLDRFGLINNALGHDVGDLLIKEIGLRLGQHALCPPQRMARLWGDKFVFLLSKADRQIAAAFAEAVVKALKPQVVIGGQRLDVSGTMGIVLYPQDGTDALALLSRVELAVTWAKRRHRSVAFFTEIGHEPTHEQLSLIGEMREALERQEFIVHYQPKLSLETNRVTSAEALVRWNHPDKGLIPPSRFIPFAEQTGFIREITPWLLDHVIKQAADWRRQGLSLVPSVNLSAHDLLNSYLVDYITGLLDKHGLAPEGLCLEITESALMEEPELALKHLDELSRLKLKLSIDDYGTGQASLAYLKTLPVNELKIDRAFITDINQSPKNAAIVRSTILLCHELDLSVVAEGAENHEEKDWLYQNNCDMVQGYVIAKPMPVDRFVIWLLENT